MAMTILFTKLFPEELSIALIYERGIVYLQIFYVIIQLGMEHIVNIKWRVE